MIPTDPTTNKEDLENTDRQIKRVKVKLMRSQRTTFFSALLSSLKLVFTESIPTAGTDGLTLAIAPSFALKQTLSQLIGLFLHEIYHVVYDDMARLKELNLDKKLWNMACDHRINLYLLAQGYELPEGGLADQKYRGWSARQIYDDLVTNPPLRSASDTFQIDIFGLPENLSDEEQQAHQEQVISNVIKAVQQAEMAGDPGSVPSFVRRRLKEFLEPKLPWNVILQNHMSDYRKEDYSWCRPNFRYLPEFYLPHARSERLREIAVGQDVSASVTEHQLTAHLSEVRYIWDYLRPRTLRVMSFDTEVHDNILYQEGESIDDIKLQGGGGTDVGPFIQYLRKQQPELALICTDGYFSMPDLSGISTDIFWVINDNKNFKPPYGTVIHFDS